MNVPSTSLYIILLMSLHAQLSKLITIANMYTYYIHTTHTHTYIHTHTHTYTHTHTHTHTHLIPGVAVRKGETGGMPVLAEGVGGVEPLPSPDISSLCKTNSQLTIKGSHTPNETTSISLALMIAILCRIPKNWLPW